MNSLNRSVFAAAGFLAVTLALTMVSTPLAAKPPTPASTPVEVVNTPLSVTGSVNATLAGPVQIGNTLLPVQAVNDALNEPYGESAITAILPGRDKLGLFFDVPDGKRLVIETVTFDANVLPGQGVRVLLRTFVHGHDVERRLAADSQVKFGFGDLLTGTHPITLWVDGTPADDEVTMVFERSPIDGEAIISGSVDGHLLSP